ncbi:MAG: glycosyltransferase family 1 protein [Phycisphaerae bacterium]|nr:glycosyltransferase family 1 protein [Phycisphaerae bacterium]
MGEPTPHNPSESPGTLLCFAAERRFYGDVIVSEREVFAGPDVEPGADPARELRCPEGEYNIAPLLARLAEPPELIVVRADASMRAVPVNLDSAKAPKVLLLGDTHHMPRPIRTVLAYLRRERFDLVVGEFNRQHLHFFREAGIANIAWIPCYTLAPCEREPAAAPGHALCFAGQAGAYHPYRRMILDHLERRGAPLTRFYGTREEAAALYTESTITLNVSLNGDLNLRVFETMAAGGFLLTDRLSTESGLPLLFTEGEHLATYDSPESLDAQIERYLADPGAARRIAAAGRTAYLRSHRPALKRAQLRAALAGQSLPDELTLPPITRPAAARPYGDDIDGRAAVYEFVQELHRVRPAARALVMPSVDPRFASDLADLPRLTSDRAATGPASWAIALCTVNDLWDQSLLGAIREGRVEFLAIVNTWRDAAANELLARVQSVGLHLWARRPVLAGVQRPRAEAVSL